MIGVIICVADCKLYETYCYREESETYGDYMTGRSNISGKQNI